jgi:hypothetical protein
VGEEGAEGAVEERAERRRGERVEAEHDREGDVEEVAGRRGCPGDGGREAERERDEVRAGQRRREEGRRCGSEGWKRQSGEESTTARCAMSAAGGRGGGDAMGGV